MSPKKEKSKEPSAAADQPSDTSDLTEMSASSTAADAPTTASTSANLAAPQSLETLTKLVSTLLEKVGDMETHLRKDSPRASAPLSSAPPPQPQSQAETKTEFPSSTPLRRSATLPPHMLMSTTTAEMSHPSRQRFRALSTKRKQMFRDVCSQLGTSIWEIIDGITADDLAGTTGDDDGANQPATAEALDDEADESASPREEKTGDASEAFHTAVRWCKPELIDPYDGDPLALEEWLNSVSDLVRSYKDVPQWEKAVLRAAGTRFKGNAKKWHNSLKTSEIKSIQSFDALAAAMRNQFRPNRAEQRRLARERAWAPTKEDALSYYFDKLLMLRTAFGENQPDAALVHDIVDCLPASFVATLHLPRDDATLDDLRNELVEREHIWRALNPDQQLAGKELQGAAPSTMRRSASEPPRPQASPIAPASGQPAGSAGPSSQGRPLSLAASYDPARVLPAADGKPRRYRRPADDQVISLNRPCARCGEDHFTFEHQHLQAKLHTIAPDEDDYPVEVDDDGQHF